MKNIIKKAGLLLFATLIFSACSTPEKKETIDLEKITVEIQAMEDAYAAAEKAGDADGVVAYYSDDAINYGATLNPLQEKQPYEKKLQNGLPTIH